MTWEPTYTCKLSVTYPCKFVFAKQAHEGWPYEAPATGDHG